MMSTHDPEIRYAEPRDANEISSMNAAVQALHVDALPSRFKPNSPATFSVETIQQLLAQPNNGFLVASQARSLVGFAYAELQDVPETAFRYSSTRLLLHQMVVLSSSRRRGVGRALLAAVRAYGEERGITTLTLDVWSFNREARAFYEANGFVDTRHVMEATLHPVLAGSLRAEV